jgi:hypothetical protein
LAKRSIARATDAGRASIERWPAAGISTNGACRIAAVCRPDPTESTVS